MQILSRAGVEPGSPHFWQAPGAVAVPAHKPARPGGTVLPGASRGTGGAGSPCRAAGLNHLFLRIPGWRCLVWPWGVICTNPVGVLKCSRKAWTGLGVYVDL